MSLLIKDVGLDKGNLEKDVYEPERGTNDTDEEVRLSNMKASVIRCLHTTGRDEDWRRSSVFYTYVVHEGKNYKMLLDGGNCVNITTKTAIDNMGLKVEPHPQPYNVTWVDKNSPSYYSAVSGAYPHV